MLLYNSFCYRVVAFGRMCLEGLFGASGMSWESSPVSAKGLQVASLSPGSLFPSVLVNIIETSWDLGAVRVQLKLSSLIDFPTLPSVPL